MNSTIGLRPAKAAPTARPAKPCSVIGVSITRRGAELVEQALADLVGALVLGDLLAHQEDVAVAAHLLGHRVAQRLAHRLGAERRALGHLGLARRLGARDRRLRRHRGGRRLLGLGDGRRPAPARARRSAAEASSPSSSSTAIGVLTFTPSVPSSTRIFPTVPSSTASNSIVALSVSISAMIWPEVTAVALLDQPFRERSLLHRRRQGGHQDLRGHRLVPLRRRRRSRARPRPAPGCPARTARPR